MKIVRSSKGGLIRKVPEGKGKISVVKYRIKTPVKLLILLGFLNLLLSTTIILKLFGVLEKYGY